MLFDYLKPALEALTTASNIYGTVRDSDEWQACIRSKKQGTNIACDDFEKMRQAGNTRDWSAVHLAEHEENRARDKRDKQEELLAAALRIVIEHARSYEGAQKKLAYLEGYAEHLRTLTMAANARGAEQ